MQPEILPVIIAGFPGLSVTVPYRKDEPVQHTLDRVTNKLSPTVYGDIKDSRSLYVDGIVIDDYAKSMEYYKLFGRVVTYKSDREVREDARPINFAKKGQLHQASDNQARKTVSRKSLFKIPKMFIMVARRRHRRQEKPSVEEDVKPVTRIHVVTDDGTSIETDIHENETVEKLKVELSYKTLDGILSIEHQHLFFDGEILENKHTLAHYNIKAGDSIHLLISRRYLFKIPETSTSVFIKSLNGKTFVCRIGMDQTVQELKQAIQEKQGIFPAQQSLVFQSKQLIDTKTLQDYGIQNDSTLDLTVRLPGGSADPVMEFADVADSTGRRTVVLAKKAARPGLTVAAGTNIEIYCKCTPKNKRNIAQMKFGLYELGATPTPCPVCKSTDIKPITVGFRRCQFRIHGIKADGSHYRSDWTRVGEDDHYQLYDPSKQASWKRLGIESKPLFACTDELCTICLESVNSTAMLPCGHQFHINCISGWKMTCPNCRASRL